MQLLTPILDIKLKDSLLLSKPVVWIGQEVQNIFKNRSYDMCRVGLITFGLQ